MPPRQIIKQEEAEILLKEILENIYKKGPTEQTELEELSYIKLFYPELFKKYETSLLYSMGLFYKPIKAPTSLCDLHFVILNEAIKSQSGRNLTPMQANALSTIIKNKIFSFSAPTSSGKSYLFMDLINNCKNDIVIVVPTRALISEYMQKVSKIIGDNKKILLLQFIENVNKKHTEKRIYIVTPERGQELFALSEQLNIDLFLFDEAQISEELIRGMRFDTLVRRIEKTFPSAKKVFAHPFINNPEAQIDKNHLDHEASSAESYQQLAVGKIYMKYKNIGGQNIFDYIPTFAKKHRHSPVHTLTRKDILEEILLRNGTILIYTSKASLYRKDYIERFNKYINLCTSIDNPEAIKIINDLKEYIGANKTDKDSFLINLMERGIVIHHGSIPLKCRFLIEKFVNQGFAKICFSTSTLVQGINMPFDAVVVENYSFGDKDRQILDLKNLIGRAGRSKPALNEFDYGYVIIKESSQPSFLKRIKKNVLISNTSLLDKKNIDDLDEDLQDIFEAISNNTFDDILQITNSQKERLQSKEIEADIKFILDTLFFDNREVPITGNEYYYKTPANTREDLKNKFKKIYLQHLKRRELTSYEQGVLSASIPIFLWKIQGRSFQQIVALRYFYVTNLNERKEVEYLYKNGEITFDEYQKRILKIKLNYTPQAAQIPDKKMRTERLFSRNASFKDFDYDRLVYDTYDYLDKVISSCLVNPVSAAFSIYYEKMKDERALAMVDYIRYGTHDPVEILLLRYGFEFEEIDLIKEYILKINEDEIVFDNNVLNLDKSKIKLVTRYMY